MLFVTNSIQLVQWVPYQGSSWRVWRLQIGGEVILSLQYADDLVLLAREEMVLQGMIDRLIEVGRWYGLELNVGRTKVMRISRQPSPVQIMLDQEEVENVEYFNYLGSRV